MAKLTMGCVAALRSWVLRLTARRVGALRAVRCGLLVLTVACTSTVTIDKRGDDGDDGVGGGGVETEPRAGKSGKVDLLVVVDNSRSMSGKQEVLASSVGNLVERLVNPAFYGYSAAPVRDMHIGVISSSLGGHGADACTAVNAASENDFGHLLNRKNTWGNLGPVPTYSDGVTDQRFLAWDPHGTHAPAGESDLTALISNLGSMIRGAGEVGCGFESQFEAFYRFLIDPTPHESVLVDGGMAVPQGIDQSLLAMRSSFLRPDSVLVVLLLSDENDCSIIDGGENYFAAQTYTPGSNSSYHLPKPRAACAVDPDDPCCRSCGQPPGEGCDDSADQCDGPLDEVDDRINLRCFDQKRRFGIDFLYPIERYREGLSSKLVATADGDLVPNPIFSDLQPQDDVTEVRDPSMVYFATVVGVPWQDVMRLDAGGDPNPTLGVQSGTELDENGTWDIIVGDPSCYHTDPSCLPSDPLMLESIEPRSGSNPVTGDPIAPPTSPLANAINGNEYANLYRDALQYACIYPIEPRDCDTNALGQNCDCDSKSDGDANPLCFDGSGYDHIQRRSHAYPGVRQMALSNALPASRTVVGSACAVQTDDPASPTYGHVPTMVTVAQSVQQSLE